MSQCPFTRGLEGASDDLASRSWIRDQPRGWAGRDFVRAVQLRTNNLPTVAIPSNRDPAVRRCRAGCPVEESLCHVLQQCPIVQPNRIARHNEVVRKINAHCRGRGLTTEEEPHLRPTTRTGQQLFKPDLVVHLPSGQLAIVDVQVSWEGELALEGAWRRKRAVYDTPNFHEAAARRWPSRELVFLPVIVGARGIWPLANTPTVEALAIPSSVRASCVHSALKWGSSIHQAFMQTVRRRHR